MQIESQEHIDEAVLAAQQDEAVVDAFKRNNDAQVSNYTRSRQPQSSFGILKVMHLRC